MLKWGGQVYPEQHKLHWSLGSPFLLANAFIVKAKQTKLERCKWKGVVVLCACLEDDGDIGLVSQMSNVQICEQVYQITTIPYNIWLKSCCLDSSIAYHLNLLNGPSLL